MNPTSLLALIVDQHSGELTPEVAELLESHLSENAASRAEAERIRKTLAITEETVLRHPELVRVDGEPLAGVRSSSERRRLAPSWLAKAAVITLLAALAGAGGFFVGQKNPPITADVPTVADGPVRTSRKASPWARYRVAPDPGGGRMQIVRVETAQSKEGALQ